MTARKRVHFAMHEAIEWHCIGDSSEEGGSTALAKRVRHEYADKVDEGGDKTADLATSFIKDSVNTHGVDEVACRSGACMPGVVTKFKRYKISSTKGAAGRLHVRCNK